MTRVIHTGDTHIGYQQYHSPERRRDFLAAFESVVEDGIDEGVDAVVHAGDLFHDRRPDLGDLQGTVATLSRLREAGIPFLAVVGNHEAKRDGQWLDLFEDLGLATRLGPEPTVVGDLALYGLDFVPESRRDELDYEFEPTDAPVAALVSHGLFEPFAHADWDTESLLERAPVDFDALLLGDNHAPGIETVDGTTVTYCGSTERASATERDDRGYNIVTVDGDLTVTRRAVRDTRTFRFVDVELESGQGEEFIRERIDQYDHEDAVTLVTVEGEGEDVSVADVEAFAAEQGALVARVNDRRDLAEEVEVDVSFADPDEAVRERIRELGLSEPARGIDETVRSDDVVDSNVRETVERHVRDLLEEEPEAIERVAGGSTAEAEGASPPDDPEDGPTDDPDAESEDDPDAESEDETGPKPTDDPDAEPAEDTARAAEEDDGQVSIGDFS